MKRESLTSQLIKNSFWNFSATFIGRLGGLIFTIILARWMLPEVFGLYNITLSLALIFLTFADLGINSAMIKYFSEEINKKNKKKAVAYARYLFKIKLTAMILVVLLLMVIAYPLSIFVFKKPFLFFPIIISAFYIFVLATESFLQAFFYAIKKVSYVSLKEILAQSLRIILVLASFLMVPTVYYVSASFVSLILTYLIVILFLLFNLRKLLPEIFSKSKVKLDKKRILGFIFWLSIANVSGIVFSYIDILMVGALIESPAFAGFYRASFALISGIAGLFSIIYVVIPILTEVEKNKLQVVFNKILKYLLILSVPVSFGAAALSKFIIRSVYGYEYLPASLPFFFVSFLAVELVVEGLVLGFFSSQEKPKIYAKVVIFSTILNIVLNYFFITYLLGVSELWAMTGAAIATLISRYIHLFALFYFLKSDFKISINLKNVLKPLASAIIMFFIILSIIRKISDMNLILGVLLVAFGAIIYFVVLFVLGGINKEDFDLINFIKKTTS